MVKNYVKRIVSTVIATAIAVAQVGIAPQFIIRSDAKSYSSAHTTSVDLNGDGKSESVRFVPSGKQYDEFGKLLIYVNGEKKVTIKDGFFDYEYKTLKMDSGITLLYVHTIWNNDDGCNLIYNYKGGKLKKVLNLNKMHDSRWITPRKPSGNKVSFIISDNGSGVGLFSYKSTYTWKSGKLKLDSKVHKITEYHNFTTGKTGILTMTVSKEFKIYSDKKCTNYIGDVPVGAKVKITKTYQEPKYATYYVTGDGYKGWYTSKDVQWESLFDGAGGVA